VAGRVGVCRWVQVWCVQSHLLPALRPPACRRGQQEKEKVREEREGRCRQAEKRQEAGEEEGRGRHGSKERRQR